MYRSQILVIINTGQGSFFFLQLGMESNPIECMMFGVLIESSCYYFFQFGSMVSLVSGVAAFYVRSGRFGISGN